MNKCFGAGCNNDNNLLVNMKGVLYEITGKSLWYYKKIYIL